jgi:hypothetical protein
LRRWPRRRAVHSRERVGAVRAVSRFTRRGRPGHHAEALGSSTKRGRKGGTSGLREGGRLQKVQKRRTEGYRRYLWPGRLVGDDTQGQHGEGVALLLYLARDNEKRLERHAGLRRAVDLFIHVSGFCQSFQTCSSS